MLALISAGCRAQAETLPVGPIRLQEAATAETADTVLDRGETIAVFDELVDTTSATLRVGDGQRPGGRIVTDPWSTRSTTTRELLPDEYAIVPSGLAEWTTGEWRLIPNRTDATGDAQRTGAISIVALHPIASVTYDSDQQNASITLTPATFGGTTTNAAITSAETAQPGASGMTFPFRAAVSNLTVHAWTAPHLVGAQADLQHLRMWVRSGRVGYAATQPAEPVAKSALEHRLDQQTAPDWWRYVAQGPVRYDGQPVAYSPTIRHITGEAGAAWLYRTPSGIDREIMRAVYASGVSTNQTESFELLAADIAADPISIWISATISFTAALEIQHTTSLTDGSPWAPLVTTNSWPSTVQITVSGETRAAFLLQAANPGAGFFRVSGQIDDGAVVSDYIQFDVADLRNLGTISAGRGYRVASPAGGTNYVIGITADIPATATLHVEGGIITGYTP